MAMPSQGSFLRAAIYAGAIGTLLSTLPLGFVIGVPLAGVMAVRFYRGRSSAQLVAPTLGFRLGALSGLFGFMILGLLFMCVVFVLLAGLGGLISASLQQRRRPR